MHCIGKLTYLCILMDWSWCPCKAIMTSASSNTNILTLFGSITLCRRIQSSSVPGVANIMWSVTLWPFVTTGKTQPQKDAWKRFKRFRGGFVPFLFFDCVEIGTRGKNGGWSGGKESPNFHMFKQRKINKTLLKMLAMQANNNQWDGVNYSLLPPCQHLTKFI